MLQSENWDNLRWKWLLRLVEDGFHFETWKIYILKRVRGMIKEPIKANQQKQLNDSE